MSTLTNEAAWEREAAQARATLEAWRAAHPQATLRQIEIEVDRHLAGVRARLLEGAAVAGPAEPIPPPCPACGEPMHWDGERTRQLTTTHDATITLTRRYARCPACGTGLFPPG
jgi:predicted RNA-binding Zn-ribbon protein involved in translation (DUF1610 family)